jgi:hypothetical protein
LNLIFLGTFGEVWNCVQRETGAHRAVKVIKRHKYNNGGSVKPELSKQNDDDEN